MSKKYTLDELRHKLYLVHGDKYFIPDQEYKSISNILTFIDDVWIEIKGYFIKDAQEKWEWFHNTYPNSQLWNKEVLKQKGIL